MISPEEMLQLERDRRAALVSTDKATLENLLSDDLIFVHTNGRCEGKRDFLESLGVSVEFLKIEVIEESLHLRPDLAVISAQLAVTVKVSTQAEPFSLQTRILSVWAPESSGWRQQAYQATRIAV